MTDFNTFIGKASYELQAVAAQSVMELLVDPNLELRPQEVLDALLPVTLFFLSKLPTLETGVGLAWKETFFECLKNIPVITLKEEILKFAVEKGQFSEKSVNRVMAAQVFGRLSELLDAESIEAGYFKQAMALCQD